MIFGKFHKTKFYILSIVLLLVAIISNIVTLIQKDGSKIDYFLFLSIFEFILICNFVVKILQEKKKEQKE